VYALLRRQYLSVPSVLLQTVRNDSLEASELPRRKTDGASQFIGMLEDYTGTISVQCSIETFGDRSVQMFEQLQSPIK
jgi:hypothetical protein